MDEHIYGIEYGYNVHPKYFKLTKQEELVILDKMGTPSGSVPVILVLDYDQAGKEEELPMYLSLASIHSITRYSNEHVTSV